MVGSTHENLHAAPLDIFRQTRQCKQPLTMQLLIAIRALS